MRKAFLTIAALLLAGWAVSQNFQARRAGAQPERVTLLVTLGLNARSLERWDGEARVTGGRVVAIEGRHFSTGDRIIGADRWVATTRPDQVAPYADVHYTEMRPGAQPEPLFQPVGLWLTIEPGPGGGSTGALRGAAEGAAASAADVRVAMETNPGRFEFRLNDIGAAPAGFLGGRVEVRRAPAVEKLTTPVYEDDEPSLIAHRDGSLSVAWVAHRGAPSGPADRVLLRTRRNEVWSDPEEVTPQPGDIFRTAAAEDGEGNPWVFWSERENDRWQIHARQKKAGAWQSAIRLTDAGSNIFHRAAGTPRGTPAGGASGAPPGALSGAPSGPEGRVFLVWQSFRDGQSDIYFRALEGGTWSPEQRVSESPANDWEPAVAAGRDGTAFFAWDSYDKSNYDVYFRSWRDGRFSPVQAVTSSPRFEAHAAVAADATGRPWVAWDYSGVNWGKDQGFLIPTPLSVPLHQQRDIGLAVLNAGQWMEPRLPFAAGFQLRESREGMDGARAAPSGVPSAPPSGSANAEHPQVMFDGRGGLNVVFRHWTRRNSRTIGSPMCWENYLTRWDGASWTRPLPLNHSAGSIEKHAALARDPAGNVWAAWMTDERPFTNQVPVNAEIYCARLSLDPAPPSSVYAQPVLVPQRQTSVEAIPVHPDEPAQVAAVRGYTIEAGGKQYKIYRGDMHRHTDISQDFKYDGSLIEVYRYALDAAGFDYIAATDHQTGYDQEFTWWQNQKLVDLFFLPGRFTPLFAYERSVLYPNGHRNIVFAQRGVRTLPIPPEEAGGKAGAARLYEYLKQNRGISMPHSSATSQGTDWRDNDPEVEPLVEIYQGYRTSYEYEGAPRAATALNQPAQKSGWEPAGFLWNAWAKGYRLGVQSSSDHWSTHISYACLIAENFTREGLLDAIRRRHSYGATDNIVLDFRSRVGDSTYIMGDSFTSTTLPHFGVRVIGAGPIQQIDLIKNQQFLYTTRPGTKEASFEFADQQSGPGKSYYYVRVLQQDGQLAWSSPIWVER